jgi:hypothetical protein
MLITTFVFVYAWFIACGVVDEQAMANLSVYPRGRTFMAHNQELVPCLIAMMRSGVTEAARVQYYCAIALCNVLRLDT